MHKVDKVGKVGISVQQLRAESISIQICICQSFELQLNQLFSLLNLFSNLSSTKVPTLLTLCIKGKL